MSFSNLFGQAQRKPAAAATRPSQRPASATASAEFWRAFLRQDERPSSAYVPDEGPNTFARSAEARTGPASTAENRGEAEPGPSVEPADIARELGLSRLASVRALQRLRRDFALKNHPDRLPSGLHQRATKRMMIANDLIDRAMARFPFHGERAARAQPFENGERA